MAAVVGVGGGGSWPPIKLNIKTLDDGGRILGCIITWWGFVNKQM